jgi:hypothetical protein
MTVFFLEDQLSPHSRRVLLKNRSRRVPQRTIIVGGQVSPEIGQLIA